MVSQAGREYSFGPAGKTTSVMALWFRLILEVIKISVGR